MNFCGLSGSGREYEWIRRNKVKSISMNNKRITLSGFAGAGKSTIGKILAKELGFEFISIGNFSRTFAKEKYNMEINDFQDLCKKDKILDKQIDEKFQLECNSKNKIVADYRLGFHFVENAFHVFLKISDQIAFERIQNADRKEENTTAEGIRRRNEEMKNRFIDKYGIDFTDERNFDLVINTDEQTPEEIVKLIINHFKKTNNQYE